MEGHVYLICTQGVSPKRYKIGLTKRGVEERLRELNGQQTAFPLKLIGSIFVSDCAAAEAELHQYWKDYRAHGEWFQFDDDDIDDVIRSYNEVELMYAIDEPEPEPVYYQQSYSGGYSSSSSDGIGGVILGVIAAIVLCIIGAGAMGGGKHSFSLANLTLNQPEQRVKAIIKPLPGFKNMNIRSEPHKSPKPNENLNVIREILPGTRVEAGGIQDGWREVYLEDGTRGWIDPRAVVETQ